MSAILVAFLFAAPMTKELTLEVGEVQRIAVPKLQRVEVSGGDGYDVKTVGGDQLELHAFNVGRFSLLCWLANGTRVTYQLKIVPAGTKTPKPVALKTRTEAITVDGQKRQATVVTLPQELVEVIDARDADGGVLVLGKTQTGERLEVLLQPAARSP